MGSKLRIGIDVHSIGSGKGGNETYYRELVRGLSKYVGVHSFALYHTGLDTGIVPKADVGFEYKRLWPETNVLRIPFAFPWRMRKDKLDVFHAQYILPPFAACKTVVSIFDLAHERFPEFFHWAEAKRSQLLVRWAAARADHIVTVSRFSANDLVEIYRVPPDKITVTHLAASQDFKPLDRGFCRERLARDYGLGFPFILYAGRLQARKNLVRLVEAFARLKQKGIEEKLVLVGKKDWQSDQVVAAVERLRLEAEVRLVGYIPQEDLPVFYNSAELFVYPSIFEGFGLPVVESMACGTPTITSYGSSLQEVAGDAAYLVDPLSVDSIAEGLEKVLRDADIKDDLARKGLRRSSEFSYESAAAQTLRVYENVHG